MSILFRRASLPPPRLVIAQFIARLARVGRMARDHERHS